MAALFFFSLIGVFLRYYIVLGFVIIPSTQICRHTGKHSEYCTAYIAQMCVTQTSFPPPPVPPPHSEFSFLR